MTLTRGVAKFVLPPARCCTRIRTSDPYWHYDILQALLVLSRMGLSSDPRASDALDELERRRLPDGRWQAGGCWWKPRPSTTAPEVVDRGRSGPNEIITHNALRAAGRLT